MEPFQLFATYFILCKREDEESEKNRWAEVRTWRLAAPIVAHATSAMEFLLDGGSFYSLYIFFLPRPFIRRCSMFDDQQRAILMKTTVGLDPHRWLPPLDLRADNTLLRSSSSFHSFSFSSFSLFFFKFSIVSFLIFFLHIGLLSY